MGTLKDRWEIQLIPHNLNPRQIEPQLISPESPSYIYCYFTLGNSNVQLSRSDFCFISDRVSIILPSTPHPCFERVTQKKKVYCSPKHQRNKQG